MHGPNAGPPLRILHILRAPVGGIFRHVLDLAQGQVSRGHQVGLVVDSRTGGERAKEALEAIEPQLALGVNRIAIRREVNPLDLAGLLRLAGRINEIGPDVLHGHGAKGGAFARLTRTRKRAIHVYTPHGGSLHYGRRSLHGMVYSSLERVLMRRSDLLLFESRFAADTYRSIVGTPRCTVRVVHNGVTEAEFEPVVPADDATDLVYVGEFRHIKGADLLIDAVAALRRLGRDVSLTLAGDGEETAALQEQVAHRELAGAVRFIGHVPARHGFSRGRLLVVPSRGDSLPYVVIEAGAAGIPMLAARVGGIPEILGSASTRLFTPDDPLAMAEAVANALDDTQAVQADAHALRERVRGRFSQDAMVEGVLAGYRDAIAVPRIP
jgi:glycosyltransferase involved in cell wall biosynthesis